MLTFTIRVAGPGQIRAQDGTRTYALGGRTVTVTQAAGTRAGVEVTLPGRLAEDVAIRVAGAEAEAERVCGAGMTWFGPLAAGYANVVPTFGAQTIAAQTGMVAAALAPVELPAAEGGDGPVRYALAPALPTGLSYTLPTESAAGAIAGVPMEAQPPTEYTLTADGHGGR